MKWQFYNTADRFDDSRKQAWQDDGGRRCRVTKESTACPAFPHQVHSPGQGARVGECPRVHASILIVEAATAASNVQHPARGKKRGVKESNRDWRRAEGEEIERQIFKKNKNNRDWIYTPTLLSPKNTWLKNIKESDRSSSLFSPSSTAFIPLIHLPPPPPSPCLTLHIRKKQDRSEAVKRRWWWWRRSQSSLIYPRLLQSVATGDRAPLCLGAL